MLEYILILLGLGIFVGLYKKWEKRSKASKPATKGHREIDSEADLAGAQGEEIAAFVIRRVMRPDDRLLNNVQIEYDGRPAEMDSIVVNKYGVFIIEVKNYSGRLVGDEDDYEWTKYHTTDAGNTYTKTARNPIKQVKRQVYLLAKYLEAHGLDVWVEGYAYLIENNSPVKCETMLESPADIDRAIHTKGKELLSQAKVDRIVELLKV